MPAPQTTGESSKGLFQDVVAKRDYEQLVNGMSYASAVSIIGAHGEEQSRNHLEGVRGVMDSVETVMYAWKNRDGSNMNAMFQNDKMIQKAQFGLK